MVLIRFRKIIILLIDLILINSSFFLAFMIRFDWHPNYGYLNVCLFFMICASVVRVILFIIFGLYQWSFRYSSISEAINVFKAVTIGSFLLISIAFFTQRQTIGRTVLLIDYILCFFLISASRFLPRVIIKLKQRYYTNLTKVLIIGAGSAGEMAAREMVNAKKRVYEPIGFVDDDVRKMGSHIHGLKVLATTDNIEEVVKDYGIEEIIIAVPSASGKTIREIISKCKNAEVKIKTIPGLHNILTGEVTIKQIRDVQPEDLLGRETVQINTDDVRAFIKDKTVLVTGAAGTIGSELCRQIMRFDPKLIVLFDYNENDIYFLELELKERYPYIEFKVIIGDIKDIGLLKHTFSKYKPEIVFHSAAHKHVPLMEENPVASVKNNILGTRNFMYAAEHYGVKSFVMISTDKAVNPTSIMGASKRIAEMLIQDKSKTARTKFMAVRFGNVIGSSGSAIPIFKSQIEKGGPVTVTHPEVKRYFMTANEAAQLVMQAGTMGKGGEVFILDMGEQLKIYDLAKALITLSGFKSAEDMDVKFIGLRPGEKMHEEMLLDAEHDKATRHDKIYIAQPNDLNSQKLRKNIKELERFATLMAENKVVEKIKEMVPSYNPKRDA